MVNDAIGICTLSVLRYLERFVPTCFSKVSTKLALAHTVFFGVFTFFNLIDYTDNFKRFAFIQDLAHQHYHQLLGELRLHLQQVFASSIANEPA